MSYVPLLSKKLKKTVHGSSESDIAAMLNNHYNRSTIDKRDKKKKLKKQPRLLDGGNGAANNLDPDDLDLMEFELPAPITHEKPKQVSSHMSSGSAMRVNAA